MKPLQTALNSVIELFRRMEKSISENERAFLLTPVSKIREFDVSEIDMLEEAMILGFYKCAAEGYAFTEVSRIKERFGRSMGENYPEASDAFLRFAVSYWTLKLVTEDLRRDSKYSNSLIFKLLSQVEFDIASVFFPAPGLHNIPVNLREQEQRRLILLSGAKIDIEEFIRGNPILSSHSIHGKRSGCLGKLGSWIGFIMIIAQILLLIEKVQSAKRLSGLFESNGSGLSWFWALSPTWGFGSFLLVLYVIEKAIGRRKK